MSFNVASKSVFVIKLVISGILFSTAVNDELVARPLILGILPSTSVISILPSNQNLFFNKTSNIRYFVFNSC